MHIAGHLRHARGRRVSQCRGRRSCVSDADAGVLKLHVFGAASRGWGHACADSARLALMVVHDGAKMCMFCAVEAAGGFERSKPICLTINDLTYNSHPKPTDCVG